MALTKIPANLLDKSAHVDFADDERLRLGTGNDLQIYHNSSAGASYIDDAGQGRLYIRGSRITLQKESAASNMIDAIEDGAVTLYHSNSAKLATSSAGATVTGTLTVTGDLDITGNVNSASVTDLDVTDKTITLGVGQTEAQSGSSGIIIDGSNASLLWDETNDEFVFNKRIKASTLELTEDTTSFNKDAHISYHSASNGVYVNGAGTNGWLRLNASGVENARNSIDLFGQAGGDYIRIKAANTDTMWIGAAAAGRVGIGTSNPAEKLEVSGGHIKISNAGNTNLYINANNAGSDATIFFEEEDSVKAKVQHDASNDSLLFTDGSYTDTMTLKGAKVGIGTTSPDSFNSKARNLVVNSNGDTGITISANTTSDSTLLFADSYAGTGGTTAYRGAIRYNHASDNMRFDTGAGERVRIESDGRFGINTTSPQLSFVVSDSGGYGFEVSPNHTINSAQTTLVLAYDRAQDTYRSMTLAANELIFGYGQTASNEAMRINSSGNVGIGESTPTLGKLEVHGGGSSGFSTLHLQATTSTQFNHSINAFNSNLTNGENNLIVIGRAGSTRNSAWMGYKWYSDASYSNCLTFGHWGNNNIVNLNGYGVLMAGGLETAPNYPGAITTARTGSSSTTTQATWGFNSTASGSHKDFGYKASGTGSYAYGVLNAAETAWMSRLDFAGAIYLTNTTVQSQSDRRLKKDIVDANSQWDDIKALQFKNFKWKDEARGTDTYLGLIADEVESVSPGLVGVDAVSAETMPDDGIDPEYKNVKYSIVWMKAVKALQEAMAKIETLEAKVKTLEEG